MSNFHLAAQEAALTARRKAVEAVKAADEADKAAEEARLVNEKNKVGGFPFKTILFVIILIILIVVGFMNKDKIMAIFKGGSTNINNPPIFSSPYPIKTLTKGSSIN